jgi:S-adenosylmethionine:tRNA ribosyltransferase-isomerase
MTDIPGRIDIEEYNYYLPEERIAQHPAKERDGSRLLIYDGKISSDIFHNIDRYIPAGSLLVFNDTRVIRARILFRKDTGATIEVFCLEPLNPYDYESAFGSKGPVEWKCIVGNLKKWKNEMIATVFEYDGIQYGLTAQKLNPEGEAWRIKFAWKPGDISLGQAMEAVGHIPLPPYVKREDEDEDYIRYQTVYAKIKGSVAAPTAGLHFTDQVLEKLNKKGIRSGFITLHVGAGTFKPVKNSNISKHEMHCEHFFINYKDLEMLLHFRGKMIAVGTTSVRTLESLYWLGVKLIRNRGEQPSAFYVDQWEPYQGHSDIPVNESFEALLVYMRNRNIAFIHGSTTLMIVPGYVFRAIDGMITNFHQPKSTLLLLVSAWVDNDWKNIYDFAADNNFRFLSYGDSSLLLKPKRRLE